MKVRFLLLALSIVFLLNFVSAVDVTYSTNVTYSNNMSHDTDGVQGVLFFALANKTLVTITRNPTDTAPFCIVFDGSTNATLVNSTWTNNVCHGNNITLVAGTLYRIGTGANATSYRVTHTSYGDPKFYPNVGNFTGGCFGLNCDVQYTISSTMYSIESITLGDPTPPAPPAAQNLTVENLTARIVLTQNFSTNGVTKNMTFFSEFAIIFRDIAQRIWSPNAGVLSIDSPTTLLLNSPTTNATGNLTVGKLIKLNAGALPTCNAAVNGSFARNTTGMLVFCTNGTRWQRVSLTN